MLLPGHIATGYFISQIPTLRHKSLTIKEAGLILLGSIVIDLDFFILPLFGYPGGAHHYFPIHTPLGGVIIFALLYFIFRKKISNTVLILTSLAMLSHLILDDLSHWLSLLGLGNYVGPQIFWLYPFDSRRNIELEKAKLLFLSQGATNLDVLKNYVYSSPALFTVEIVIVILAIAHKVLVSPLHLPRIKSLLTHVHH